MTCTRKRDPSEMRQHLFTEPKGPALLLCPAWLCYLCITIGIQTFTRVMISQLFEKTGDKPFKGHHIVRKHGIYAHSLKWEACHQGVICVCCPEEKKTCFGSRIYSLKQRFPVPL